MSSHIRLTIGGVDYTPYVDIDSVHVDNNMVMTNDSASIIIQLDGELARPMCGQEFIWGIVDDVSGVELYRDFGGVVVTVSEDTEGPSLVYSITIKSYDHWFNRHLVCFWYSQYYVSGTKSQLLALKPGDAANINNSVTNGNGDGLVNRIVETFCPGFTCNNVVPTAIQVVPQYFNYVKPSEAINTIAGQLSYGWYVDWYKDLHFYPFESFQSPLPANYLDVDNDLKSFGDLVITEDGQQVFNRIFLRGFKTRVPSPIVISFLGDGSTKQWSLGYRVSSLKDDMSVVVYSSMAAFTADTSFQTTGVNSNGTKMTLARDIADGSPDQSSAADTAYIHYTQYMIRLPNYNGSGTLPTGYVIGVYFHYLKDVVYMGQDSQSQANLAKIEGTDSQYEFSVQDKSLTNSTLGAPMAKAQLMLLKNGKPQINGTFTSFLPGWRAGQCFTLLTKKRMGGINQKMYVLRVSKTIVNNVNGSYVTMNQIQFASSPFLV